MLTHTPTTTPQKRPGLAAIPTKWLLLAGWFAGAALCALVFLLGTRFPQDGRTASNQSRGGGQQTTFESRLPLAAAPDVAAPAAAMPTLLPVRANASANLPAGFRRLDPGDPQSPLVPISAPTVARALPVMAPVVAAAPFPASTPVDYAARDRRIASLKQQIDALDEQISTVRNNPRDSRYWFHYYGGGNGGVNQAALQKYLDGLDQQRTALRREKWQLEGR